MYQDGVKISFLFYIYLCQNNRAHAKDIKMQSKSYTTYGEQKCSLFICIIEVCIKLYCKKLSEHNITTWDIFNKLEENNEKDECNERRTMKKNRYKVLKERYSEKFAEWSLINKACTPIQNCFIIKQMN